MKYAVCSPTTNVPLREYYVEGWCWHIYPTEQQAVQAEDAMPAFYMHRIGRKSDIYNPDPKTRVRNPIRLVTAGLRHAIKDQEKDDHGYKFLGDAHVGVFKEDGLFHAVEKVK